MCNTPNTDSYGNVIRSCYCDDHAAELATLRAENERLRDVTARALELIPDHNWVWKDDAKEALK